VFNANFINISVISWQSVLLVEETGEKHHNPKPEILRFSWNNHGNFEQKIKLKHPCRRIPLALFLVDMSAFFQLLTYNSCKKGGNSRYDMLH
jgi:hypothetical protein